MMFEFSFRKNDAVVSYYEKEYWFDTIDEAISFAKKKYDEDEEYFCAGGTPSDFYAAAKILNRYHDVNSNFPYENETYEQYLERLVAEDEPAADDYLNQYNGVRPDFSQFK